MGAIVKRGVDFFLIYISAFFLFLFSLTFGILFVKGRGFLRETCFYYGFGFGREIPKLKSAAVEDVIGNSRFSIAEPITKRGINVLLYETLVINALVKRYNPKILFEIGTFDGRTTINLAINSPDEAIVYTLDLPLQNIDKSPPGYRFTSKDEEELPEKGKIVQLYGDSAKFDYSPYLDRVDFIFIDGNHSYDYVVNDTQVALKLLRQGKGVIVWHDYNAWNGVTKALNEFQKHHPEFEIRHIAGTTLAILVR